jgi:hypothetical protein
MYIDKKTAVVCSTLLLIAGVALGNIAFNITFIIFLTAIVSSIGLPIIRFFMGFLWFIALEPIQSRIESKNAKFIIGLFQPYQA